MAGRVTPNEWREYVEEVTTPPNIRYRWIPSLQELSDDLESWKAERVRARQKPEERTSPEEDLRLVLREGMSEMPRKAGESMLGYLDRLRERFGFTIGDVAVGRGRDKAPTMVRLPYKDSEEVDRGDDPDSY